MILTLEKKKGLKLPWSDQCIFSALFNYSVLRQFMTSPTILVSLSCFVFKV
jgi:predicted ATPase